MRQSGITVTAVTNIDGDEIATMPNNQKPKNAGEAKNEEKTSPKKEKRLFNRRGKKKD